MANFIDDIPEARRETLLARDEPTQKASTAGVIPWVLMAFAVLGIGAAGLWWISTSGPTASITPGPGTSAATDASAAAEPETTAVPPAESDTTPPDNTAVANAAASSAAISAQSAQSNELLGHRPYAVADENGLTTLSTNPMVRLKPEVAQKVETMMAEARAVGVSLDAISGFRSLEDQQYLFFDLKAERGQTTQTRAEVSAPPGYSEHHTGYAVDFIDLSQPATELNAAFEDTPAFRWLEKNAAYYGFELSFPKDNEQNVTYEPWHWRYVGNQESLEMFYQNAN
ncbi:MAG: M15 family metallopeptidase [Cyanobacteria bacterium P01_C01_bin.118]